MSAHNSTKDLYKEIASGRNYLADVSSSTTLNLQGRQSAVVNVTATCTITLPSVPAAGVEVFIRSSGTPTITIADAGGTIGTFVGTSGASMARCVSTDANSWSMSLQGDAVGEAATINIADAGAYTLATTVEAALASLFSIPNAKFSTSAAASPVAVLDTTLTGARHVYWQNTTDGAVTVTMPTAQGLYDASAIHYVGYSYLLTVINRGNGTVTLDAATGISYTGEATAVTLTTGTWLVTFTSASAATVVKVLNGTIPT
jgi:hypothetical protein